jgi:hypothetical protein
MLKQLTFCTVALLFFGSAVVAQIDAGAASSQLAKADPLTVNCSTMEVMVAEWPGASVVIFHQRDKADGRKLSELLKKYAGQEVQFETGDGKQHRATVARMKTCFGRGVLIFVSDEANLGVKEEFILRFDNHL